MFVCVKEGGEHQASPPGATSPPDPDRNGLHVWGMGRGGGGVGGVGGGVKGLCGWGWVRIEVRTVLDMSGVSGVRKMCSS